MESKDTLNNKKALVLELITCKTKETMREFHKKRFEKELIQSIPAYTRDRVIEIDYRPGEKLKINRDIYSLTIAANITKEVTP